MDFMEMREALSVAGCVAANGNEERFYGARPGAAQRVTAKAVPVETIPRHAEPRASSGDDPRIAQSSVRQPS